MTQVLEGPASFSPKAFTSPFVRYKRPGHALLQVSDMRREPICPQCCVAQAERAWYVQRMATTSETVAFERGIRPLMEMVLPDKAEAVIAFRADPQIQARIEELARKSTEGQLTGDERAEYVGFVRANKFVAILKRQARRLTTNPPADDRGDD